MNIFIIRIFIYTILPILAAGTLIVIDKSAHSRARKYEIFLIYLFGLGVTGSGIGGAFGHLFLSDIVAESVGWPSGSPFQLEMGFANLALGFLGAVAISRRDGFREATVLAATTLGFGATIVHFIDILQTGNLAPGNTLQNVSNILRPVMLILFLIASRRVERSADSETHRTGFEIWRVPRIQSAVVMTISVATGFGLGFGFNRTVIGTILGILVGGVIASFIILRGSGEIDDTA